MGWVTAKCRCTLGDTKGFNAVHYPHSPSHPFPWDHPSASLCMVVSTLLQVAPSSAELGYCWGLGAVNLGFHMCFSNPLPPSGILERILEMESQVPLSRIPIPRC